MRNTKQKDLILKIINNSYSHPTANEVYVQSKEKLPDISLGTVYRNLNVLADLGMIKRIKMPDNTDRFDKICEHHAHFICLNCNRVIDVENDFKMDDVKIGDTKVVDYEINFKGICEECLKKEGEI